MSFAPTEDHLLLAFQINRQRRPLLPEDSSWIRPNISYLESQLQCIDKDIHSLTLVLDHLQRTRETRVAELQSHRSVYSPFLKLPRDIMVHIFSWCLPPQEEDSCLLPDGPRWSLQKVCGLWREIITRSPSLWSTVIFPCETKDSGRIFLQIAQQHLAYSKSAPLFVGIECLLLQPPDYLNQFIDLITKESKRWSVLEIRAPETHVQRLFRGISSHLIPQLREIYVYVQGQMDSRTWPTETFVEAPMLLRLDIPRYSFGTRQLPLQATHLSAAIIDVEDFHCLETCPTLEEWHLHTIGALPEVEQPLVNNTIRILRVDHPELLGALTIPRLEALLILACDSDLPAEGERSIGSVCAFLDRSDCRLETLVVVEPSVYESPLFLSDVLSNQHSLTTMDINISTSVFVALKRTASNPGLLPRLKFLTVTTRDDIAEEENWETVLVEMVASRRDPTLAEQWNVARMEKVRIDSKNDTVQETMKNLLATLVSQGLKTPQPYDYRWNYWEGPAWFDA